MGDSDPVLPESVKPNVELDKLRSGFVDSRVFLDISGAPAEAPKASRNSLPLMGRARP